MKSIRLEIAIRALDYLIHPDHLVVLRYGKGLDVRRLVQTIAASGSPTPTPGPAATPGLCVTMHVGDPDGDCTAQSSLFFPAMLLF